MCSCNAGTLCGYHADQILAGLAEARDLSDNGFTLAADRVMKQLRDTHGPKVNLVLAEVRDGLLDLSAYGNPNPRSN